MAIPKLIHYSDNSYVTDQGTLFEGFETFADWTITGSGATGSADSTHKKEGLQSLQLNSVSGSAANGTKTINKNFSAVANFIIWIYVIDPSALGYCRLYFSSVTDFSKSMEQAWNAGHFKAGWNRLVVVKEQFSVNGGESWSNTMIRMRVRFASAAPNNTSVSFDDLRYDHQARPKVIITFDDGLSNVYDNAKPIMDANGQAGIHGIITSFVGTGVYMTLANLISFQNAGWDISNHTKSHPHLDILNNSDLDEEVNGAFDWLVDNGFGASAHFLVYPFGDYNDAVIAKVKERHVIARSVIWGEFQPHFDLRDDDIDLLVKCRGVYNYTAVATIEDWIDSIITQNAILVLKFHGIVDADPEVIEYLTADFQSISNYLKTKSDADDLDVITFSDYYNQFMPSDLTSVVYLEHGALVPFPIMHEPSESINRSEDKRLKVYSHPLAGDKKRVWRFKCVIDNSGSSGYKWRDLEYFYWKVVKGAKRRCVFIDANSVQYLVRIIGFAPKAIGLNNKHEVTMILEEDYT